MAKRNLQSVADELGPLAATLPTQRAVSDAPIRPQAPRLKADSSVPEFHSREREKAFTLNMRLSLHRQLDRMAADAEMTMKAFILDALGAKGLAVLPEDLMDRRGNRPKQRT